MEQEDKAKVVEEVEQQIKELLPSLPKANNDMCLYQGFWYGKSFIPAIQFFQRTFQAQDTDIIVASNPKSGTTWLKALTFSVVNRTRYTPSNTPLLTTNPHDLVPLFTYNFYTQDQVVDLTTLPSPRLLSTHFPFTAFSELMEQSNCRIVYICRNPFDSAVSLWHHYREAGLFKEHNEISLEDFIDMYFEGITWYGPYWDHVLEYWKKSLEKPNKVLFLKYEYMKEDTVSCLKKIAEFIGYPFTEEEDRNGVIEEIIELCSFKILKNLEINNNGSHMGVSPNTAFFRKGEVGKWVDYLSPSKKKHLEQVMQDKLSGSGLSFKLSI